MRLSSCCLSLALLLAPAARAAAAQPAAEPPIVADHQPLPGPAIERLAGLAKLWGKVKYFHPFLAYRPIDWDQALLEVIPEVEAAKSAEDYRQALGAMLAALGDPQTRVVPAGEALDEPAASEDAPAAKPAVVWLDGNVAHIDARNYAALLATGLWEGGVFTEAFQAASKATGVILDLRGPPGAGSELSLASYFLSIVLHADLPALLGEDLLLPAKRSRMHSGYRPQEPGAYAHYYSGFVVQDFPVLAAAATPILKAPLVILTNREVGESWLSLAAFQIAGLATIVHEGPNELTTGEGWTMAVELPEGIVARVRTAEPVLPDGTTGFEPAYLAGVARPAGEGGTDGDLALGIGLGVLRGELQPGRPSATRPELPRVLKEKTYAEPAYPARALRLLALFRYWNVIEHFFPYKQHLDRPWDTALSDLAPRLAEAADELAYHLAAAELVARIQDSHGSLGSPVFQRWLGSRLQGLETRFVEGKLVVTAVLDEELERAGTVAVGDVVLAVDGEPIEARRARLAPYLAASTPQALDARLARNLLAGPKDQPARLRIERGDGQQREVLVERRTLDPAALEKRLAAKRLPVWTRLPSGLGYVDLTRLERAQVAEAFEAVRDTPGLILDMRGYPRGTAWSITPYFAASSGDGALFRRRMHVEVGEGATSDYSFIQPYPAGAPWQYRGRVVVLIDERAISQSEHSCLLFESALPGITFLGTPTNGANGDVTGTVLPGGISTYFSGHDVRHADGRQLQRLGIQPHVAVAPTIAGIRAGRDELLEAAVELLAGSGSAK